MNSCRLAQSCVTALAIAVGLSSGMAFSEELANAAPVVGAYDETGVNQGAGTDILKIQLSQGNPDDDGLAATGSVQGVTIHLHRLAGIGPNITSGKSRIESAPTKELLDWDKDLHISNVTDSNGVVRFDGLADGIYLVTSSAPDSTYREINPFLVAVPFHTLTNGPIPVPGVIVAKSHNPEKTPPVTPTIPPKSTTTQPELTESEIPPAIGPSISTSTVPGKVRAEPSGSLAITGAQIVGLVIAAAFLIGGGFLLILANKNKHIKGASG